ncbi:MAG: 23S rRNA (adenine(2503)-C(2))-methyltransferase RlmN [Planctomycetes bacterium]|nr:23S rRNA (adenine(2503)-C(2))-methyltransferase RlmN [Planctomycetota bacterium]
MTKASIVGLSPTKIKELAVELGAKPFVGKQLADWLYKKRVCNFDDMSNLSKEFRGKLADNYSLLTSQVVAIEDSGEGTTKLGVKLPDGYIIECVLMREDDRFTACISTQVGCAMGCRFCASGQDGLKRNLTHTEILEQFFHLAEVMRQRDNNAWLTNVVVMGMGEPLHNFAELTKALEVVNADWGFNLGARRITVSTVGLPDRIRELAKLGVQFKLAISLHGVDDESRTNLIPSNAGLDNILNAAADYFKETGREVTFEYTLVGGQNDSEKAARKLAKLLRYFPRAFVNLIPMNPVEGSGLKAPDSETVERFVEILTREKVNAHVRRKRGRKVQAACGQLRLKLEKN